MSIEIKNSDGYYIAVLPEPVVYDPWGRQWFPEVDKWCTETFGATDSWGKDPVSGWKRIRNQYFFTDESKRTWFIVRWHDAEFEEMILGCG